MHPHTVGSTTEVEQHGVRSQAEPSFLHSLLQDPTTEKLQQDSESDFKKFFRGRWESRKDIPYDIEFNTNVPMAKGPQHQAARARVSSLLTILQELKEFRNMRGLVKPLMLTG